MAPSERSVPVQLASAVFLASTVAVVLLGSGNLMSNQAAVAAVLVVALTPTDPHPAGIFGRFLEAVIGGGAALALSVVMSPDPLRRVRGVVIELTQGLEDIVQQLLDSLHDGDMGPAHRALDVADAVARQAQRLDEALAMARESVMLAGYRHRVSDSLASLVALRARLDILISTMRGLARACANTVRHGTVVAPELIAGLESLLRAYRELRRHVIESAGPHLARTEALESARLATSALQRPHDLRVSVMVGQIRSACIDILRATGLEQEEAVRQLEDIAGRTDHLW